MPESAEGRLYIMRVKESSFGSSTSAEKNKQIEIITGMDLVYYNAAVEGKIIEEFKTKPLQHIRTPNRNTILHVHLTSLRKAPESSTTNIATNAPESSTTANFVKEILNICPLLLLEVNDKNETPLHIAARFGHATIVEVLITCAKDPHNDLNIKVEKTREMLRIINIEKDTALHEAVRYNHLEVVKLLTKEDPEFSYSVNDVGETPLYMAVERNFRELVFEILVTCSLPVFGGPQGRTALHAAVIWNDEEMTRKILEKNGQAVIKKVDQQGWTPLHCAAYFRSVSTANLLLNFDRDIAYMKDAEGRTALHLAAHRGSVGAMQGILSSCPDCCELVDKRGWNVLHFAVNSPWVAPATVKVILNNPSLSNLLNEKDIKGNTPMHQHSKSNSKYVEELMIDPRVDKMAFNRQHLNAYDMALISDKYLEDEKYKHITGKFADELRLLEFPRVSETYGRVERRIIQVQDDKRNVSLLAKVSEHHLVVNALIATVTFAAGITVPGGFFQEGRHAGSAILTRKAAFKVFFITDSIAMVLSSSAAFILLLTPLLFRNVSSKARQFSIKVTYAFTMLAMVAMVLSFVTGTFAVLAHSLDLAVPTCIIGLSFFLILCFVIRKLCKLRGTGKVDQTEEETTPTASASSRNLNKRCIDYIHKNRSHSCWDSVFKEL